MKKVKTEPLHNRLNSKKLKEKVLQSGEKRITLSFYQFAHIKNPNFFRDHLYTKFHELGVYGRVYVATEGINAQINVPVNHFNWLQEVLNNIAFLSHIRLNQAVEEPAVSFYKLTIKVKGKIVADGLTDESFDVTQKGQHLSAEEFNELTGREDTVVIDMRNHYESEVGHFENAILPDVDRFRDSLPVVENTLMEHRNKHIVMYCTGGIRCEKASAYFKHKGFEKVYQLEGGIIKYARDVQQKGLENKFRGKNFVFDERLGERISDEIISHCHQCGKPCDTHTNCINNACNLLFIQCAECAKKYEGCCSTDCAEVARLPAEEQKKVWRKKQSKKRNFRKGRAAHLKQNGKLMAGSERTNQDSPD